MPRPSINDTQESTNLSVHFEDADSIPTGHLEELLTNLPSFPSPSLEPQGRWQVTALTPRHREIMRRLLEGAPHKQIAQEMGLHPQTIYLITTSALFIAELQKMEETADFQIIKRAEALAGEALDVMKVLMRYSKNDAIKKAAAGDILDRAGYAKVEKRLIGIVSGEDVIRELNRRKRLETDSNQSNQSKERDVTPE